MCFYRSKKNRYLVELLYFTHASIVWDTGGVDISVSAASCTERGLVL